MGIDTGPFQDITAIEGGIFGYSVNSQEPGNSLRYHNKTYVPSSTCATMGIINVPSWTPGASGRTYSQITLSILVGEFWRDHPANPFPGELSESPGTLANLYDKRVTHVDSGENFKISEVPSSAKLCQEIQMNNSEWSTHGTTVGGLLHTRIPLPALLRTTELEYWQYNISLDSIGTEFETWTALYWANDNNNSPAVFKARFMNQSFNTRVTWT